MYRLKRIIKRLFSPITIMFVPHDSARRYNIKLPSVGIVLTLSLWVGLSAYIISAAVETTKYAEMKESLDFYRTQFNELQDSIALIKKAEQEFANLLSKGDPKDLLEGVEPYSGSLDPQDLRRQIDQGIEKVREIREFLQEQKNIYLATPSGWPIQGRVTSAFGKREDPRNGGMENHSGIDISAPKGTEIKATAEGIVVYSGWSPGNGNLVVIEHGMGFRTLFAHNSKNLVTEGQRVKRGDVIALVGSTGNTTGPHLHYEVWLNGKPQDPMSYVLEVVNVSKKKR